MFDRLHLLASRVRGLFAACLLANCAKCAAVILRASGFGPKYGSPSLAFRAMNLSSVLNLQWLSQPGMIMTRR